MKKATAILLTMLVALSFGNGALADTAPAEETAQVEAAAEIQIAETTEAEALPAAEAEEEAAQPAPAEEPKAEEPVEEQAASVEEPTAKEAPAEEPAQAEAVPAEEPAQEPDASKPEAEPAQADEPAAKEEPAVEQQEPEASVSAPVDEEPSKDEPAADETAPVEETAELEEQTEVSNEPEEEEAVPASAAADTKSAEEKERLAYLAWLLEDCKELATLKKAKVYEEPDANSEVLLTAKKDARFEIVEVGTEWVEIRVENVEDHETGFISILLVAGIPTEEDASVEEGALAEDAPAAEPEDEELVEIDDYVTPLAGQGVPTVEQELAAAAGAQIRVGADGMSPIIRAASEGEMMQVIGRAGDWYVVLLNTDAENLSYTYGFLYKDQLVAEEAAPQDEVAKEAAEVGKSVTVFTSRRVVMEEGETVVLTSRLEGFEDCEEIYYVWKVDKGDGTFVEVPGVDSDTYSFVATAESLGWSWQLTVLFR